MSHKSRVYQPTGELPVPPGYWAAMSQENVERIRRAYAGGIDPDMLAPGFELHQTATSWSSSEREDAAEAVALRSTTA